MEVFNKSFFSSMDMSKPVISFDFDGVLTYPIVQEYAYSLGCSGFRIIILTSRPHDALSSYQNNDDLYEIAKGVGCDIKDIIFTDSHPKENYLANSKVIFHLDDDYQTILKVNDTPGTTYGVHFISDESLSDADEMIYKAINKMNGNKLFHLMSYIKPNDVSDLAITIRNAFQRNGMFHGLTCCSYNNCNRNTQLNHGLLIATKEGWVCPCGNYKQKF